MLTETPSPVTVAQLCPLDGDITEEFSDGFLVCTGCREILESTETVSAASVDTWAAYLVAGNTDTDPSDAPLSRLNRKRVLA